VLKKSCETPEESIVRNPWWFNMLCSHLCTDGSSTFDTVPSGRLHWS